MRTASILLAAALLSLPATARAEELPPEYREAVSKGLEWMARNQSKDGHWEAFGGQYPVTMTGISGMASSVTSSATDG